MINELSTYDYDVEANPPYIDKISSIVYNENAAVLSHVNKAPRYRR